MNHWICLLVALPFFQAPPRHPEQGALPDSPAFKTPGAKISELGKNLWIDTNPKDKRVLVRGAVCRKNAPLEEFMCL